MFIFQQAETNKHKTSLLFLFQKSMVGISLFSQATNDRTREKGLKVHPMEGLYWTLGKKKQKGL